MSIKMFVDEKHPFMASALIVIPLQVTRDQVSTVDVFRLASLLEDMAKRTLGDLISDGQLTETIIELRDNWPEPTSFPTTVHEARERGLVNE